MKVISSKKGKIVWDEKFDVIWMRRYRFRCKIYILKNAIILHLSKQKYKTYIWLSIISIKYFIDFSFIWTLEKSTQKPSRVKKIVQQGIAFMFSTLEYATLGKYFNALKKEKNRLIFSLLH